MNKDRILQTLKKEVRSLLIASKLGLSVQELEHDYRTLIGSPLPTRTLNYRSTMELLLDMPDVVNVCTQVDGSVMLSAVVNEQTKGIADLVSRQKTSSKRKVIQKRRLGRPLTHMDLVRRGRVAPVLPAFVKSELRDLLSISPLLVSQLESSYYERFGRSFQYTRYGFYSLVEVLRSVSDFVQVEQTKAGSLLMLKTPVIYSAIPWSSLQSPPSGNVLTRSSSLSVNKESNAPKKPPVPDSPSPSAAPKSSPLPAAPYSPPLPAAPYSPPPSAVPKGPPSSALPKGPPPSAAPKSPPLSAAPYSPPPSAAPKIPPLSAAPKSPPLSTVHKIPPLSAAPYSPPLSAAPKIPPPSAVHKIPPPSAVHKIPPLSAAPYSPPPSAAPKIPPLSAATKIPPLSAAPYSPPLSAAPKSPPLPAAPYSPPLSAAPKSPPLPAAPNSPPLFAAPTSGGVTTLDKLFMAAQAEYFANKPSVKSASAVKAQSERENIDTESILSSGPVPSATVPSISSEPVSDLRPHIHAYNTRSHEVDTAPIQTDVAEPSPDRSVQCLEEKLQEGFKLCLSQTRAGFVISNDLRQDIKRVVRERPEGLPVSQLLPAYKLHTGKDLPFKEMGFMSVLELIGALGDILCIEDTKYGQEWSIFDIELKRKKDVDGERTDKKELSATDGLLTRWNVRTTPKPERLKPPSIIFPSDGQSLWGLPPDAPVSDHQIPPDAVRKQKLCALPRMKREFMVGVNVENVTSPSNFYIRCFSKETSQKLEDMMIEMRFCYSNEHVSRRYIVPEEYVAVGEVYALRVDEDVWWYRVIVHSIIGPHEVQVFYPDYGTLATVKRCWLRFLKACYMRLPAQAVPAVLACLKPVKDRWSAEATKVFHSQCARGPLVGVVVQYVSDQLCLYLCDTSSDEDIYLHQVLIDAGHASLAQEPWIYPTRVSFARYLIQSSEPPQEPFPDPPEQETSVPPQSPEVLLQEAPLLPTRVNKEPEPELPYLEAFPMGEDIWDEVWSFSGGTATPHEALKPPAQDLGKRQEETTVPGQINNIPKRSDGERLSPPLEEFYISLIKARNKSEKSATLASPLRKCEESAKTVRPAPDTKDPSPPLTPEKENLQRLEDNLLFCESSSLNQTAAACNPLTGFQKFQIPRRSATAALGAAARLAATPGSLLHWGY